MKIPQNLYRNPSTLKPKLVESLFAITLALIVFLLPLVCGQYGDFADIAGDYCRARTGNNCCDGRIDTCSLPILGTLCYCDQFCNRTGNPDCCPDYWNVCLGIRPRPSPPPPLIAKSCFLNGVEIPHLGSYRENCNECKCRLGTLECEEDQCLINEDLLQYIQANSHFTDWTASNYSQFWGKKLSEGLLMLTGTLPPDEKSLRMHPIKLHYDEEQLPREFDARAKWEHISKIRDQGWCGASWAFSTLSVAQDRLAIESDGTEVVELSPQNLLSCNRRGQQACNGGHVERAWNYLRKIGVIPEDCFPYTSGFTGTSENCKVRRHSTLQDNCEREEFPMNRKELYTTEPAYRIASKEGDIMWELMSNGPIQALMRVYQDFFLYKGGVYSRTDLSINGKFSVHSVKILGWGEAPTVRGPVKYWTVANSWGENWGRDGTFRIQRGTNESDIEQFILAVRTHLATEATIVNRRRTRLHNRRRG